MKKILTLMLFALGATAFSCGGDDPSPKPPVIVKPDPKPDPPKEPVLTITQVPQGQIAWGQSAKVTITSENAKFFWKGDSVTSTTLELKYLLKDTTFNIEAKGYKSISKSHTITVSTPTEYEKLIVGAWQMVSTNTHRPYDVNDLSKGHYWSGWEDLEEDFVRCLDILHFAAHKQFRIEYPCAGDNGGSFTPISAIPMRYFIGTDSVGRPTLVQGTPEAPALDPSLIHYAEVIEYLSKDTMIIYQEIKPDALVTGWRTYKRMCVKVSDKPYAFAEEEGGIAASRRKFVTTQKPPSYAYKEGIGVMRIN